MPAITRIVILFLLCNAIYSCKLTPKDSKDSQDTGQDSLAAKSTDTANLASHPQWIVQGNIYEVNVRQYTKEGTFAAFSNHLGRLKEMGVQTLWFMPINPISQKDRKGRLGSYYAVASYTAINPEFGTLADWKTLVQKAHNMGFKVIIDWVPNHTGADHYWLTQHPDFYVKDSAGKPVSPFDWTDTRKLNYVNPELVDTMINCMKYWLTATDIDGFRCDVAGEVPDYFWRRCIAELKKTKAGIFMLAEADKPELNKDGFDASYGWALLQMMYKISAGQRPASGIDSVVNTIDSTYPSNAFKLCFTSNHDENSWNKSDYGTFPGASHAPFAVLTQTISRSVPLIYSGQEEPLLDSLSFFYKDQIPFGKYRRAPFYKTLLELRKRNPALASDAAFRKIDAGSPRALYAYTREKGGKKVLVVLNLSKQAQTVHIRDRSLAGKPANLFLMNNESPIEQDWKIEPWGYAVYEY